MIFIASTVIIFSADFGRFKLSPESPGRGESGGSSSSGINYSGHSARRARTGRDQARRESPPSGATGAFIDLLPSPSNVTLGFLKVQSANSKQPPPGRCLLVLHIRWSMSLKMRLRLRRSQSKVQRDGCWTEA